MKQYRLMDGKVQPMQMLAMFKLQLKWKFQQLKHFVPGAPIVEIIISF